MTRKKYALKFIKKMTKEDKKNLLNQTKTLITPKRLKSEEEILYRHFEYFLKQRKEELKKEKVIDLFDLRKIKQILKKEKEPIIVVSFPSDMVLIPYSKKTKHFFKDIK